MEQNIKNGGSTKLATDRRINVFPKPLILVSYWSAWSSKTRNFRYFFWSMMRSCSRLEWEAWETKKKSHPSVQL